MDLKALVLVFGVVGVAVSASDANEVVASTDVATGLKLVGTGYDPSVFHMEFGMLRDGVFTDPWISLASDVPVLQSSVGQTLVFAGDAVQAISDQFGDADDLDVFGIGLDPTGVGYNTHVSGVWEDLFDSSFGVTAADLAGTFDEIHVTFVSVTEPFEFDLPQGSYTEFTVITQWDFVSVPAPSTLALFGVFGYRAASRRRK